MPQPPLEPSHQKQLDIYRTILRRAGGGSDTAVNMIHLQALERLVNASAAPKGKALNLDEQQNLLATAAARTPAAIDPSYRGTSNEERIYDQALNGWLQAHPAMRRACGAAAASQAPWAQAQQQRRQQEQLHKQQLRNKQPTKSDAPATNIPSNREYCKDEPRHISNEAEHAPSSASSSTTASTKETSKLVARSRANTSAEPERGRRKSEIASAGVGAPGAAVGNSDRRKGGGRGEGKDKDELLVLPLESSEQLEVQLAVLRDAMVRANRRS